MGHNLGMRHDYVAVKDQGFCRKNADGEMKKCSECDGIGNDGECCTGYMDIDYHPHYWSPCSNIDFRQHYVSENWAQCMPAAVGNPSSTTSTPTYGTYTHT